MRRRAGRQPTVPKRLPADTLVTNATNKPILFVDVDGVISLFGFAPGTGQLPGPLHWIDDNLSEECHAWAKGREAPTLLVETSPSVGLTDEHVSMLLSWAERL